MFPAVELRRLELAEHECPWGEMAQNYRTEYLASRIDEASDGWSERGRKAAGRRAQRIAVKLWGPQPKRPFKVSDLVGS